MARKQINSDILAEYDVGEIFKAMYNNALGINPEGGDFKEMTQGQVITARAVLDKYIPSLKATDITSGGQPVTVVTGTYIKPVDD